MTWTAIPSVFRGGLSVHALLAVSSIQAGREPPSSLRPYSDRPEAFSDGFQGAA